MGQRIELTDIEAVCLTICEIKECCCCYNFDKKRIVLFYSLYDYDENFKSVLINRLKDKLPAYMLPNQLTLLECLPKNKNGKIDRNYLKNSL